ncbi:energy transducer TonB [Sphingopyxis sp.]|uniref:energy transducer TonB n=1 Tax=Sphingopyxis sp. TaxID=1908224 RepID=UPI0039C96386
MTGKSRYLIAAITSLSAAFAAVPATAQATPPKSPVGVQAERREAVTRVKFLVGTDGLIKSCEVIQSAHPELDADACKLIMEKGRFNPPRDGSGISKPFYREQSIRWVIESSATTAEPKKP